MSFASPAADYGRNAGDLISGQFPPSYPVNAKYNSNKKICTHPYSLCSAGTVLPFRPKYGIKFQKVPKKAFKKIKLLPSSFPVIIHNMVYCTGTVKNLNEQCYTSLPQVYTNPAHAEIKNLDYNKDLLFNYFIFNTQ